MVKLSTLGGGMELSLFVRKQKNALIMDIQKNFGSFRFVNRGPVDDTVKTKEYDDGWYVGQTSNRNFRKGKGTFYFLNGDRYIGEWSRNKMDGRGVYQYKNGDRFEGILSQGQFSGD